MKHNEKQSVIAPKSEFQIAVEGTAEISTAYKAGLQALKSCDKQKISASDSHKLNGSVDIDSAVKDLYPEENRWDYAIGYDDKVCFVEVHPASTSEVETMLKKLSWLKQWLKNKAPKLSSIKKTKEPYIWLSTKSMGILKTSSQFKKLSASGIKLTTTHKF